MHAMNDHQMSIVFHILKIKLKTIKLEDQNIPQKGEDSSIIQEGFKKQKWRKVLSRRRKQCDQRFREHESIQSIRKCGIMNLPSVVVQKKSFFILSGFSFPLKRNLSLTHGRIQHKHLVLIIICLNIIARIPILSLILCTFKDP